MTPEILLTLLAVLVIVQVGLIRFALSLRSSIMSAANDTVAAVTKEIVDATARVTATIAAAPSSEDVVAPETVAALKTAADTLAAVVPAPPAEPPVA
jgi:hypothetical protein